MALLVLTRGDLVEQGKGLRNWSVRLAGGAGDNKLELVDHLLRLVGGDT
jgi:hypothetical protein